MGAKHYREAVTAKRLRAQRAIFFGFTDRLIIHIYLPMITYFFIHHLSWRPLRGTSHSGRFAVRASHVFHSDQNHLLWPTHHPTFHAIERSELPAKQAAWRQHANQLAPTQTDTIVQRVLWVPELQGCYSLLIHFSEYSGEMYPKMYNTFRVF